DLLKGVIGAGKSGKILTHSFRCFFKFNFI
ncbi:unnamed protein product, partial [marine sediment metagenome]